MQGYRTLIVALVQLIVGLLAMSGVIITEEMQTALVDHADAVIGGILVIAGIVQAVMRMVTKTPVGGEK